MRFALELALGVATAMLGELTFPRSRDQTRDRALAAARRIQPLFGWKHFDCFIDRIAWNESRYNSTAGRYLPANTARGLLGMRPKTARAHELGWLPLWAPPELQVALASSLAWGAVANHGARDWLDVRAYWAYPSIADDDTPATPGSKREKVEARWTVQGAAVPPCPGIDGERLVPGPWPGDASVVSAATVGAAKEALQ
jgi:hypothetical protein